MDRQKIYYSLANFLPEYKIPMVNKLHKRRGINCNFHIIKSIKEHNRMPSLHQLGISKRMLSYYCKKLITEGIIERIGYATWVLKKEVTSKTSYTMPIGHYPTPTKNIRGHGFIVTLKLPNIPNWQNRENYMKDKGIEYKPFRGYQRISIRNHKVWLSRKAITIYTPKEISYYEKSAEDSKKAFLYDLHGIFVSLENLFKVSLRINKNFCFNVARQHYGKINDEVAQEYNRKGKQLRVSNEHGLWLLADYSLSEHELEAVSCQTAVHDVDDVIVPFLNDLKAHYEKTGETIKITELIYAHSLTIKQIAYIQKSMLDIVNLIGSLKK